MLPSRTTSFPVSRVLSSLLIFWLALAACERGASQSPEPRPSQIVPQNRGNESLPDAEDDTDRLAKDNYASRQQATLEMWGNRDKLRDEVQQAARHPDPEVAGRAKWILRQWRRGALPDTPPDISRRLQRSNDASGLQDLLEAGQFAAVVVAVEESLGTIDRESIQQRISSAITRRFPVYIKTALEGDSLPALLKLIDLTADSKEMAVCRVQLMQQLELSVDATSLLPTSAESWSDYERTQAKVLVLMILGRVDDAVVAARQSGDRRLISVCQMLGGLWNEMAEESVRLAKTAEQGTYEQTRYWSQALIAADRCDNEPIRSEAVQQLSSLGSSENGLANELRWKCLAGHGEVDAALEILSTLRPDGAAELALITGRGRQAFQILGLPLDQMDQGRGLEEWVDVALESQRGQEQTTAELRAAMAMIRCLLSIGRRDAAWTIATRMCESEVSVDEVPIRDHVIWTLTHTSRKDWALRLAATAGEEVFSPTTQHTIAASIRAADQESIEILMNSIKQLKPTLPFGDRLQMVYQLLSAKPAKGFDPAVDFKALFDHLVFGKRQIQQFRGRAVLSPNVRLNLTIAKMFANNGRANLANRCLDYLIQNRDIEATFEKAERELDGGKPAAAQQLFELVWARVQGTPGRYRSVAGDDADRAVKALVGQWTLANRSGDDQLRDALMRQLQLTLCSPSAETRNELAAYLGDRGELELAQRAYQSLLPMTAFGTPGTANLYEVAWKHARLFRDVDLAEAVRWYDLAASGTLESTVYYRSTTYVTLPLDVRRWALEAAAKQGDQQAARRHVARILQLHALDVDTAERLLPELRQSGMDELANTTFETIFDLGIRYTNEFPWDATTCNNVAWAAAKNKRRLNDALELTRQAVDSEPGSAIFRDTLAEVLFLLGRTQEALEIEESCVLDDPGQWHLHEQIEKYRDAISAQAGETD